MNILFLTLARISDISTRGIYSDLIRLFAHEGHNIYIVRPNERRYKERTNLVIKENIQILSIKTLNIQKTNFIEKGLSTLLIENQFLKGIRKHFSHVSFDLVLYSTPPITFTKIVRYIMIRDRAVSYLLLKDIFPQNAVDLGVINKGGW